MTIKKIKVGKRTFKIKDCKGLKSAKGLMFDKMDKYDGAIIYANNIWMPFVKHELDLFFVDERFKILETKKAVPITLNPKTWKVYKNKSAKYCIEIKAGMVKEKISKIEGF